MHLATSRSFSSLKLEPVQCRELLCSPQNDENFQLHEEMMAWDLRIGENWSNFAPHGSFKACELENLNFFQAPVLLPVKDPNIKLFKPGAICEMECLLCHASMLSTETIPSKTSYWHKQPQLSYYSPLSSHQCALMAISHVCLCCCFLQFGSLLLVSTGQTTKSHSEKTQ